VKVITVPTVTLVSAPVFHAHPVYELPLHPHGAESIIAMGGKVCYDSYGIDGNRVDRHIRTLVDSGHHSVLEHVHVGVLIEGISRGCSHEIVRHRMFNYSQRSTRYTAEDDAAIVLDPYFARIYAMPGAFSAHESDMVGRFLEECEASVSAYVQLVEDLLQANPDALTGRDLRKWCRGKARQLLPHALETRMVMTGNLRAWRHFLVMRSSRHAEAEIRRLAEAIYCTVQPIAPTVFADMKEELVGGFPEWTA
jgi:thymidylate synthase (FAD)